MGYTKGSPTVEEEVLLAELSWVRPYLAIGPRPDNAVWDLLVRETVSLVIDLNDDVNEGRMAVRFGLGYRGLKVPDPTGVEEFLAGLPSVGEWINAERVSGGRVYLHCTAGVYRSPTFAMAYLMAIGEPRDRAVQIVLVEWRRRHVASSPEVVGGKTTPGTRDLETSVIVQVLLLNRTAPASCTETDCPSVACSRAPLIQDTCR